MGTVVFDWLVLAYAGTVAILIAVTGFLYIWFRRNPVMLARNVPMLFFMSTGAFFHIVAEMVGNRHVKELTLIEKTSCVLWGYWLPYVFGAGLFFTGLYLRLFTYTSAVSRNFTEVGARRALRMRVPIALVTLCPIVALSIGLSVIDDDGAFVDEETGQCESGRIYKIAVGVWMSICIMILIASVAVFRGGFVADILGEVRKQVLVAFLGIVVMVAVVFVLVFAESGLDNAYNRVVATLSVTTLYLWALGIMGMHPLWRVMRRDHNYAKVLDEGLDRMQQPLESVVAVIDRNDDKDLTRLIFNDFLEYCADEMRPGMDRGRARHTDPRHVVLMYRVMDAWTQRVISAHAYNPDEEVEILEGMPPFVSEAGILRSAQEIITKYFTNTGVPGFVDLYMDASVRTHTTHKHMVDKDPIDTFKTAMWWAANLLDDFFGTTYIDGDIMGREVFQSKEHETSVRVLLTELRRDEGRRRVQAARLADPSTERGGGEEESEESSDPEVVELEGTGPWPHDSDDGSASSAENNRSELWPHRD